MGVEWQHIEQCPSNVPSANSSTCFQPLALLHILRSASLYSLRPARHHPAQSSESQLSRASPPNFQIIATSSFYFLRPRGDTYVLKLPSLCVTSFFAFCFFQFSSTGLANLLHWILFGAIPRESYVFQTRPWLIQEVCHRMNIWHIGLRGGKKMDLPMH